MLTREGGGCPRLLISLASPTEWAPRPSRSLRTAGHGNACACGLFPSLRNKSYSTGIIGAHPFDKLRAGSCKKRKDGTPSVEMLHTDMVRGGPPAGTYRMKASTLGLESYPDQLEPQNQDVVIWRFMNMRKFRDLITPGELYFCRADLFANDEREGLAPEEYLATLGLNPFDINERRQLLNTIGSDAQFREAFYINCWHLLREETSKMWKVYGTEGVAICSRYGSIEVSPQRHERPRLHRTSPVWREASNRPAMEPLPAYHHEADAVFG
jgi:hypothetical protein